MANETRTVPRSALMFAAELQPLDGAPVQADGSTLFPFRMIGRTSGVANHPLWGPCVHDFSGMEPAPAKISVDYCHNQADIIGFADQIELQPDALLLAGSLVSMRPDDRAAEIFAKGKAGVPYEASILTNLNGLVVEPIPEGFTAEVNGQQVEGPVTIFRNWSLWGIAICPYGSDANTSVQFAAGQAGEVEVTVKGFDMSKAATGVTAPAAAEKTGQDYLNAFGAKGGVWFAQGLGFYDALQKFADDATAESKEKDDKLAELAGQITALQGDLDAKQQEYDGEVEKIKAEYDAQIKDLQEQYKAFSGGQPLSSPPAGKTTPVATPLPQNGLQKFAATLTIPGQTAK
jgi:hypothetical protein